jgi:hypothetical protein
VPTSTGAIAAGSVRRRAAISQMRTSAAPRRHGRFGKREKSGVRLALKASRPSCASSLA